MPSMIGLDGLDYRCDLHIHPQLFLTVLHLQTSWWVFSTSRRCHAEPAIFFMAFQWLTTNKRYCRCIATSDYLNSARKTVELRFCCNCCVSFLALWAFLPGEFGNNEKTSAQVLKTWSDKKQLRKARRIGSVSTGSGGFSTFSATNSCCNAFRGFKKKLQE